MKLTVNVTQECINKGLKESAQSCPIALAIQNALLLDNVVIAGGTIEVSDEIEFTTLKPTFCDWIAKLPGSAVYFVDEFDRGEKVDPFTFEITVVDKNIYNEN